MTSPDDAIESMPAAAVLVAVVVDEPGVALDATIRSVHAQQGAAVGLLVLDVSTSDRHVDRAAVLSVIPEARVVREPGLTYVAAANRAAEMAEGFPYLVVCRSGVVLGSDAVEHLVKEALASNAGVVGPKLIDRADPTALASVGLGTDKFAHPVHAVELGELDQEQHDGVADVFAVDTRCFLIRVDLFRAIGGFDEAIPSDGEDIDLGWRSLLAGARVLVAPDAVVAVEPALPGDARSRYRHQVRTVLTGYGPFRLARVLIQTAVLWTVNLATALITLRFGKVRDLVAAWVANLRHLGGIRRKRAAVRRYRQVSDGELREYQQAGSAQLRRWLAGRIAASDASSAGQVARRGLRSLNDAAVRNVALTWLAITAVLVFGSRHLLTDGLPAVGSLADFGPSGRPPLSEWWGGWWHSGLGRAGPAATLYGAVGGLGTVLFGATGPIRFVLMLGMIPLGAIGLARALAPMGSRRASVVGALVYLALPVAYHSLAGGSWAALVAYGLLPWILGLLVRATDTGPYQHGSSLLRAILGVGLLVALATLVIPLIVLLVAVVVVGLLVGSLVAGHLQGMGRMIIAALAGILLAVVMHLPWALTLLADGPQWAPLGASGPTDGGDVSLAELLRFDTGPIEGTLLIWGFMVAAAYPLVLGRGWRLVWAIRAWFVALAGFGLAWAAQWGALDVPLPSTEFALVPAALGLAMAVGVGAAVFELDLLRHRFGWRQLLVVLAAAGLVVGVFPFVGASFDGRWSMPRDDYAPLWAGLLPEPQPARVADDATGANQPAVGAYRVLWIGADEVLPARGWPLIDGATFALSDDGPPDVRDQVVAPLDDDTARVRDSVRAAVSGRSHRLGRLVATEGIRYIVVVERLAPAPFADEVVLVSEAITDALGEQLDLQRIEGVNQAVRFYENTAWIPTRAAVPPGVGEVPAASEAAPVLVERNSATRFTGPIEPGPEIHAAMPSDSRWSLQVDGRPAARADGFGWENRFLPSNRGEAQLSYATPITLRFALVGQVIAWLALVGLILNRRRAGRTS